MTACKISLFLFLLLLISYSAANAQAVNLEAAKKEGRVVLYGTVVPQAMESIFNSFEKKYGIKVDYWRASANGVAERAVNEWRAGRPGFDVVEGNPGLNATLKKEGGFAKYIPPSSEKFAEHFQDKDSQMTAWRLIPISVLYNTDTVKAADRPRTLDDLIDPKWKGKISYSEPHSTCRDRAIFLEFAKVSRRQVARFRQGARKARTPPC